MISTAVMKIEKEQYGELEDGRKVYLFTLANSNKVEVSITNYGGIITAIRTPDNLGKVANIVLGFDNLQGYLKEHPYFGALIGRYGNRIAKGEFTLDGMEYKLAVNNGENHLHGGIKGFDRVLWEPETTAGENETQLILHYRSEDGEEGYPGNLDVHVTYALNEKNELHIRYQATADKATPVNLTNHSYFNLSGSPKNEIFDHEVKMNAGQYIPVDDGAIPVNGLKEVDDTAFDFRTPKKVGRDFDKLQNGYDHTFVVDGPDGSMNHAATVVDHAVGRKMEVLTTEPGFQFYTGNYLGEFKDENGEAFGNQTAMCFETQHFPDSPNRPEFPSTILKPGETYESETIFRFSSE